MLIHTDNPPYRAGKTWTLALNHPYGHTPGVTVVRGRADQLVLKGEQPVGRGEFPLVGP